MRCAPHPCGMTGKGGGQTGAFFCPEHNHRTNDNAVVTLLHLKHQRHTADRGSLAFTVSQNNVKDDKCTSVSCTPYLCINKTGVYKLTNCNTDICNVMYDANGVM